MKYMPRRSIKIDKLATRRIAFTSLVVVFMVKNRKAKKKNKKKVQCACAKTHD